MSIDQSVNKLCLIYGLSSGSSSVAVATCQERSHDMNDSNYVTDVYYTETCSEMETDSL